LCVYNCDDQSCLHKNYYVLHLDHFIVIQTCSGATHSRMSDDTTVTSPFHSSSLKVSSLNHKNARRRR